MELLAPAGSYEALTAAVQSGADAVYIGGSEFSARRNAVNFSAEEIKRAADYCHIRRVKLHVAANILIKEKETEKFLEYIKILKNSGVDAVIIQDIGMAAEVHRRYPDLVLHASTQMTAASVKAAQRLKDIGFSRVVLARELSYEAIKEICEKVDIETEIFAHGAICMSYSGQCLMSSMIGGRSGNRGMCAQPCRLPYDMDGKKGYLLSPKDLCLLKHLPKLSEIGVTSIKIEGRLKRKEYTAAVTGIYRKYLDNPLPVCDADLKELADSFNRSGFTDGYFEGKPSGSMMSYNNPANSSENVFSDDVKRRCTADANFKKSGIYMTASLTYGNPLTINVWDDFGNFAQAVGNIPAEYAVNRPLDRQRVLNQLSKLGSTPFFAENTELDLDDGITIPISEINDVRRRVIQLLEKQICDNFHRDSAKNNQNYREINCVKKKNEQKETDESKIILVAEVYNYEQAKACINAGVSEIYAPTPLANRLFSEQTGTHIIAQLPPVCRDDKNYDTPKTDSILVSNIGQIDEKKRMIGDFRLNITNSKSVEFFSDFERVTLSPELNLHELKSIAHGCEIIAYGRLPLMVMENCPMKALGKCQHFKMKHCLTDRKNEKFSLRCCEGCTAELLNSKPIYMADQLENVKKLKINAIRLIFTVENSVECDKIIREYKMALKGNNVKHPEENTFTRGHFYRGVE